MSFSNEVKIEICEIYKMPEDCKAVMLYGILSAARTYSEDEIELLSETKDVSEYTSKLIGRLYRINIPVINPNASLEHKKELFQLKITDKKICKMICDSFNCGKFAEAISMISLDERITWAFIKGVFLGCGSVSGPEAEYHLEFAFKRRDDAIFAENMLSSLSFIPKRTTRREAHLVYFKDSTSIEDILTGMGAVKKALQLMDTKVIKDLRNRINRRNNCETANMQRSISACAEQVSAIEYIISKRGLDFLSDDLQRIANFRLQNPEMSLNAMAKELSGEFSKSAIDRRLKKMILIAAELKQQKGK